jgi:hypothetical protein
LIGATCQLPFNFSLSGSDPRNGLSGSRTGFFLSDFISGSHLKPVSTLRKLGIGCQNTGQSTLAM